MSLLSIMIITHTEYIFVSPGKDDKARKEVFVIGEFSGYKSPLATGHDK